MVLVVDIRHWLEENGEPHPRMRRRVLRLARLIEYGGPLEPGQTRRTLVECSRRPRRRACDGLLWVAKTDDGVIAASCDHCNDEALYISGWQDTMWAEGPMEPLPLPQPR